MTKEKPVIYHEGWVDGYDRCYELVQEALSDVWDMRESHECPVKDYDMECVMDVIKAQLKEKVK